MKTGMTPQVHAFEDLLLETNWGNFVCVCSFLLNILYYQHLSATEHTARDQGELGCYRW